MHSVQGFLNGMLYTDSYLNRFESTLILSGFAVDSRYPDGYKAKYTCRGII